MKNKTIQYIYAPTNQSYSPFTDSYDPIKTEYELIEDEIEQNLELKRIIEDQGVLTAEE